MGYPTPEEAALAEGAAYPQAQARVVDVDYEGRDHAVVTIDTAPS